jgi:methoxymalonate biosynthesis acyl carrier protein
MTMTESDDIEAAVGQYIAKFNYGDVPAYDQNIFLIGTVTSLIVMQILMFVEKKWNISVPNDELTRANFESVSAIAGLVRHCQAQAA